MDRTLKTSLTLSIPYHYMTITELFQHLLRKPDNCFSLLLSASHILLIQFHSLTITSSY